MKTKIAKNNNKKNKSSKSKIVIGFILIALAFVGGAIHLLINKDEGNNEYHAPASVIEEIESRKEKTISACPIPDENSIIIKETGTNSFFKADASKKEVRECQNYETGVGDFFGLPEAKNDGKSGIFNETEIISKDKSKAIIVSKKQDENGQITSASEFVCKLAEKECSPSIILEKAAKSTGSNGKWYEFLKNNKSGEKTGSFWTVWDSERNILFGSSGTGTLRNFPILSYNLNTGALVKSKNNEKPIIYLPFPENSFSPSLSKFVIISNNKKFLFLHNTANFDSPIKKIDISQLTEDYNKFSRVYPIPVVFWSEDEKTLIIETRRKIFTLDIEKEQLTPRFTSSGDFFDSFLELGKVQWSKNGRFIFFADHDKGNGSDQMKQEQDFVLKAIDLFDMDKPMELIRTANPFEILDR